MTKDAKAMAVRGLDEQLCFAVYSAAHAFNRAYRPFLAGLGLTYPQYLVMLVLWEQDGQSVKAIGERQVLVDLSEAGRALREKAGSAPNPVPCAVEDSGVPPGRLLGDVRALREALLHRATVED